MSTPRLSIGTILYQFIVKNVLIHKVWGVVVAVCFSPATTRIFVGKKHQQRHSSFYKIFIPGLVLFFTIALHTQAIGASDTLFIDAGIYGNEVVNASMDHFVDSSGVLTVEEIREQALSFTPLPDSLFKTTLESVTYSYWLRLMIANDNPTDTVLYLLKCPALDSLELWAYHKEQLDYYTLKGFVPNSIMQPSERIRFNFQPTKYHLPLSIPPNETRQFWIRIKNTISFPSIDPDFLIANPEYERLQLNRAFWPFIIVNAGFAAILLFVLLLSLYQYFNSKDLTHLYYAGYLLSILIFFWYRLEKSSILPSFFGTFSNWYYLYEVPITGSIFLFYVLFVLELLKAQRHHFPLIYRFKKWVIGIIIAYIIVFFTIGTLLSMYEFWRFYYESRYIRFLLAAILLVYFAYKIVRAYKSLEQRFQYLNLFLIGTFFLVFFGGVATLGLYDGLKERFAGLWEVPLVPIQIGILLDVFFYSLALIYREQLIIRDNIQIKLNKLTNLLKPHFVGNALNNLEDLIYTDQDKASSYIYTLSSLFKDVVIHSQDTSVTLQKELDILKNYMDIQQIRFPQKFSYEIQVVDTIKPSTINVPPMILQPHVENAIKYAFTRPPFTGEGRITIAVQSLAKDAIICIVEDNGIGRLSSATAGGTGKGITTTNKIIEDYNRIFQTKLEFRIIDKYDDAQQPLGTRIELFIPSTK